MGPCCRAHPVISSIVDTAPEMTSYDYNPSRSAADRDAETQPFGQTLRDQKPPTFSRGNLKPNVNRRSSGSYPQTLFP